MSKINEKREPEALVIKNLFKYNTEFNADSVEWCPHKPHQNAFVCGNYQLTNEGDSPKRRLGRILLFSVSEDEGLTLLQTIETAAVLDQKWCHNQIDSRSLLGVATAAKRLEIYQLNTAKNLQLELLTSYEINDEYDETLLLSLDWSTGKYPSSQPNIICSDSNGNIHLFNLCDNKLELKSSWHAHEYEAWIVAFYYWDVNIMFSGGDDAVLLKFDKRMGDEAVFKNHSHEAGVTCVHSNPKEEFLIATGSYDSYLRLWDMRRMKSPLQDFKMPGTLWRLKWDPFSFQNLLVACMLDGVHVVETGKENLHIIASYWEHKSIAYGADWSSSNPEDVMIGTCSFYDNLLSVSRLKLS